MKRILLLLFIGQMLPGITQAEPAQVQNIVAEQLMHKDQLHNLKEFRKEMRKAVRQHFQVKGLGFVGLVFTGVAALFALIGYLWATIPMRFSGLSYAMGGNLNWKVWLFKRLADR